MVFLFKKTKLFLLFAIPLWILVVTVGRLTVFTEYDSAVMGIVYPVIVAFSGAYIIYIFALRQANKIQHAYNDILAVECDAERYLEVYGEIREEGRKHDGTVYVTETSYATALHLAGRADEAREIVRALIARPDFGRQRTVDRADAYVDVGNYSVTLGDLSSAREAIAEAEALLDQLLIGTEEYNRICRAVTRVRYSAEIAESKLDEALEYFTDASREYTVPYTKVNRMNTLAQIYRQKGDLRLLRKCLSYVAEHGGTMQMAKAAREELETLPAPTEEPTAEPED